MLLTYLIRARSVDTELVAAHLIILTLVNILTGGPVRAQQEPVRTHAEHLQGNSVSLCFSTLQIEVLKQKKVSTKKCWLS